MTDLAHDAAALDFLCPEEMSDPSVTIQRLYAGDRCRLYEKFLPPFFVVSRFEDVNHVLMNPTRFLSGHGQGPNFVPPAGIVSDAPMHTFFRRLVQDDFKPGAIARLRPRLERIADELLDAVEDKETWDLHDDFSFPLPVTIICEIFGVPTDDLRQFKKWSDTSVAALSAQDPSAYVEELMRMRDYLVALLHEKHDDLDDEGLLARIARARRDGAELSDEEAVSLVLQLFVAGNETTTSLITNVMMRLLGDGYQWADFCAGKIDMKNLINESLRYDPPLLAMFRTTAGDETIAGTRIPAGTKVMIHYAAANRDPDVFENPETFDVHRPVRKITSFALGVHFCIGAELAKLEAEVMLEALRKRCPNLEMIDEGERIGPFLFWGRRKLPVRAAGGH
ncbi:cytochrome P450 [Emcibacter sp. SYSU 3D8]|uniref:cytochrome P450 n=1 Tax=Emcibacter sp. SYSU 3D8 TaxID=3133969 RepID=UPI0031FEA504